MRKFLSALLALTLLLSGLISGCRADEEEEIVYPSAGAAPAAEENGQPDASPQPTATPAPALQADGSSRLGSMVGGLSGPAIRPLSVFQTWRVAQEVAVDVVGCGGIVCAADVKEYMAAGAKAVEIGTANFTEPETIIRITEAL